MTHFPVTNSNLSALHLGFFVQEKYGLSNDVTCSLLRAGINDTYLVTDDTNKFVFRVYSLNWRTRKEIDEEIRLLIHLKENYIPVSYPIADKQDVYIQMLNAPEGLRFGVLFSFANGQKLHTISAESHFEIGKLMGRMHQATINLKLDRIKYTPKVLLIDSLKQLERFLQADTEEMSFMHSTQKYLLEELSNVKLTEIRTGIVHLDIWFDNLNITSTNAITIFDFDFCGNGWLCMDIAYYILQLCNVEKYEEEIYQPKVDGFIKGYESITKISDEEKRLIPLLGMSLYFFYLGIQCQRYDNWSNSFLSENYLKRYINGLVKRYFKLTVRTA